MEDLLRERRIARAGREPFLLFFFLFSALDVEELEVELLVGDLARVVRLAGCVIMVAEEGRGRLAEDDAIG